VHLPAYLTRDALGEIRLTGHRIGLYSVVRSYREGATSLQIQKEFPTLPQDLIEQVLEFYAANQAEVDAYVDECRAEINRQMVAAPKGPDRADLQRRWTARGLGPPP
jgi:uncharacterized protein (DUF433 family)